MDIRVVPNHVGASDSIHIVVCEQNEREEEMKAFGIACAALLGVIFLSGAIWIIADGKKGKK